MNFTSNHMRLQPYYKMKVPAGNGPFPAIMIVSGCNGFNWNKPATKHYNWAAEYFYQHGYVVIFIDYLKARNISSCFLGVSQYDVGNDIIDSVAYLQTLSYVKKTEISVVGWSYGGGGVLAAIDLLSNKRSILHKAIAFYPACFGMRLKNKEIPLLILFGDSDNVTSLGTCRFLVERLDSNNIVLKVYANALHAFDMKGLPPKMPYELGGSVGYNSAAAEKAWDNVFVFLGIKK